MYNNLLPLNEKCIIKIISLMVVNMNNGTNKVVNMEILHLSNK